MTLEKLKAENVKFKRKLKRLGSKAHCLCSDAAALSGLIELSGEIKHQHIMKANDVEELARALFDLIAEEKVSNEEDSDWVKGENRRLQAEVFDLRRENERLRKEMPA